MERVGYINKHNYGTINVGPVVTQQSNANVDAVENDSECEVSKSIVSTCMQATDQRSRGQNT